MEDKIMISVIIDMLEMTLEEYGDKELILFNGAGDRLTNPLILGSSLYIEDALEFE